ncbi:MAG: CTP synthase (glutamine hydrolyzing) [Candidatus Aenigmarchaeota archaeon]|nr:CTP synthase (glutamine hydrolyzing) [Candidatus Aenigmarchaeota archaeon]
MRALVKWVFITGGVLSGLGKGIVAASIGRFFEGYKVVPVKCDGYLNVDPGTMNPVEHGEVFVLKDGGEVDMDFGHYERFFGIECTKNQNLTMGKVFHSVIEKERKGEFLGKTVQMVPHVVNEIKGFWRQIGTKEKAQVLLIEIGGTVGDIENELYVEAARQTWMENKGDVFFVHVTYVPVIDAVGEQKSKPTQQSVELLRERGIQPDLIVCRANTNLAEKVREKIALYSNLPTEAVVSNPNLENVYKLPIIFEDEGVPKLLEKKFDIKLDYNLKEWRRLLNSLENPKKTVKIKICGKYTELKDSYYSLSEALKHAAAHCSCKIELGFVETTNIEEKKVSVQDALKGADGIIVPGGFGSRGTEGKIACIKFARENNLPFLGLCFGMQLAVAEFARSVGMKGANSTEIDQKTKYPVIFLQPEQRGVKKKGGTMRLGDYTAVLKKGSVVSRLYESGKAVERHRHRFEVNPRFVPLLQKKGLVFSGFYKNLAEFIELPKHKFFVGTQAHPEFKSRLEKPSPLFFGFVKACAR